jgi:hypothetical protein
MDMSVRVYPHSPRGPYIREVKSNVNNELVFNGYFYFDQKDLPLQRVMMTFGESAEDEIGNSCRVASTVQHIEIYEKISGEDTSEYYSNDKDLSNKDLPGNSIEGSKDDDEDSLDGVCFFPTEITTLKYRVIKSDLTPIERKLILETIVELDKDFERNRIQSYIDRAEAAEMESDDENGD